MVGDRITIFVVPTLMIFALDASALEVGIVSMAQYLGIPLLGPVAGVLVDRWDKRLTLIGCDLVRLVAVLVIPIAYWLDVLSTPLLFACVAAISGATIFFSVGYLVAVPAAVTTRTAWSAPTPVSRAAGPSPRWPVPPSPPGSTTRSAWSRWSSTRRATWSLRGASVRCRRGVTGRRSTARSGTVSRWVSGSTGPIPCCAGS